MTKIHLIRHGQTDNNIERRFQGQSDSLLTEKGKDQARLLAQALEGIAFDAVFASSNLRAYDTAKILVNKRGLNIEALDALREIYLGNWEGQLEEEIKKIDPKQYYNYWNDPSKFKCLGSETFFELQTRALNCFKKIVKNNPGKEILVVSHGALLKTLLAFLDKRPLKDLWKHPIMGNCAHSIVHAADQNQAEIVMYAGLTSW